MPDTALPRTYIIAEAGINHNGDEKLAADMIDAAAKAGADAIKFQMFRAEKLVSIAADDKEDGEALLKTIRSWEVGEAAHERLRAHCREKGIDFISTPFDPESLDYLVEEMNLPVIKIGSGEVTNGPLLLAAGKHGAKVILSTGMSTLAEVGEALGILAYGYTDSGAAPTAANFAAALQSQEGKAALAQNVSLLHCTSAYPTPVDQVNLEAMDTLRDAFHLPVGLSDHTEGVAISLAAIARGAEIIEKHFTLDRKLPGPDQMASMEPDELVQLVTTARAIEAAIGSGEKVPAASEQPVALAARRSLVAAVPIAAGDVFSAENLTSKRPAGGLSPMVYWNLVGQVAETDFAADEQITHSVKS